MLSPPSMPFMNRAALGLPGLALLFMLAGGCGQNDGGRCQVESDCASGLVCQNGSTGNGRCERPGANAGGNDAAVRSDLPVEPSADVAPDQAQAAEVERDLAQPDSATADASALDTDESEAGGLDTM